MGSLLNWFSHNWHDFGEVLGLFIGIIFTGFAWRLQFFQTITEKHRALSMWIEEHKEIHRIYCPDAKVLNQPISIAERKALEMIFAQYETGWDIARFLDRKRLEPLTNDVGVFFCLPLPRAVWSEKKRCHAKGFQKFVDRALEAAGRLRQPGA